MLTCGSSASSQRGSRQVTRAEQLEHGGQQHAAHDERVEEHGDGEPEAELLQRPLVAEREGEEDADHDRRGRGDHPPGQREAVADRGGGVRRSIHCSRTREIRNTS
jgi:hypothetical protein